MATKKRKVPSKKRTPRRASSKQRVNTVLARAARRLKRAKSRKEGSILLRLRGSGGGNFCLECKKGTVRLVKRMPRQTEPPLIELIGPADVIAEILDGKTDALSHFLRGRFRVRGDLGYASDLAREFRMVKHPF